MIDLSPLARRLAGTPLADWANTLQAQLDRKMEKGHGDLEPNTTYDLPVKELKEEAPTMTSPTPSPFTSPAADTE